MGEPAQKPIYGETRQRFYCGARAIDDIADGALVDVLETFDDNGTFCGYRVRLAARYPLASIPDAASESVRASDDSGPGAA